MSTMNLGRGGVAKIPAVITNLLDLPSEVVVFQELNLNSARRVSYTDAWRARGFQTVLGRPS